MTGDALGTHVRLGPVQGDTSEQTPIAPRAFIAMSVCGKCYVRSVSSMVLATRPARLIVAEADGNRTRQGPIRPLTGFEDRGTHQASGRLQVVE